MLYLYFTYKLNNLKEKLKINSVRLNFKGNLSKLIKNKPDILYIVKYNSNILLYMILQLQQRDEKVALVIL